MDPSAEKYLSWTPYNYCADNPINLIDLDGMDWYQWQDDDGNQSVTWREGDAASMDINGQTYSNIGATYTTNIDDHTTITYTQNEATSMTTTALDEAGYVAQTTSTGCKTAADAMVTNSGATPSQGRAGEILMTNHDANGKATTATGNANSGVNRLKNEITNGNAVTVGVDYKPAQVNNLASTGGDGMTDHFVTVVGMTENLSQGNVTSTTFRFFDPRSSAGGTQPSNTFSYSNNKLTGSYQRGGNLQPYNYTVTTVRKVY